MDRIAFIKASGCGNDFLLIEAAGLPAADLPQLTVRLCDRHDGVGADGVEWLLPDPDCDARIRLINADGSAAEISGNGTRCVAAHLVAQTGRERVAIRTDAGVKSCRLLSRDGVSFAFETAMGKPQIGDPFSIRLAGHEVTGVPVSMGNPHFVIFVTEFVAGWQAEAAEIQRHSCFIKQGINVEFVRFTGPNSIEARFFERGAGETQSSGTGSSAAAVASINTGPVSSPVAVQAPGGTQQVRWEGEVFLSGSARLVCRGEFLL